MRNEKLRGCLDDALSGIGENPWLLRQVLSRAEQQEDKPVKKKLSLSMVLAILLVLTLMGAGVAAVIQWNVLDFLKEWGGSASVDPVEVHRTSETENARLSVESAVWDGETLAAVESSLTFADLAGYTVKMAIAGNDGTGLVKTADTMIVTATDANGNVVATITYTVIVMGDVNCDGMAWSNDATAVMQIFFGGVNATKPMLLAADITCDGTIETPLIHSTDAQRIMHKYFSWGLTQGGYESALR